jgi:V8-like Glu-specific endopeptidase
MERKLTGALFFAGVILALTTGLPTVETPAKDDGETPLEKMDFTGRYSKEIIDEHRMMSLDRTNGVKTYQTDEEVIRTLDLAHSTDPSSLFTSPSMPSDNDTQEEFDPRDRRAIFNDEGKYRRRISRHPYCAIGELVSSDGVGYCSVFMIGPHHAVTAGHCVYNTTKRAFHTNFTVSIGRKCNRNRISVKVVTMFVYIAFIRNSDPRYNLVYLKLDNSSINASCYLGISTQQTRLTEFVDRTVCGYTSDKTGRSGCMYCGNGKARLYCVWNFSQRRWICHNDLLVHTCNTVQGMDGGPMMSSVQQSMANRNYIAYGVHVGELKVASTPRVLFNTATRFTAQKIVNICLWLRSTGAVCNVRGL